MSAWRGKDKSQELERLATLAGEASAEAAASSAQLATTIPPAPPDLTAGAFFDVDNTMMMGASIFYFARGLAARKFFTSADLAGFVWDQLKFRVGGRENKADIKTHRERALSFVAGRTVEELTTMSEEIYDELMADKIWSGTRALAQMHLDAGQRVWLVTATPIELAAIISRRLGLTGALGTVAETKDGVYTGRLVGDMLHGRAKAHAVRARVAGRPEPQALHGLFGFAERRPDAVGRGHRGRGEPGQRPARRRSRARLGDPRLPHRPQSRPDRCPVGARRGRGRGGGRRGDGLPPPLSREHPALARLRDCRPSTWTACGKPCARRVLPGWHTAGPNPAGVSPANAQPRKTLRRWESRWYSVCWIDSRTWSVSVNTSIGSSTASGP